MKVTKDFHHYNPRCNCGGTVKAGTEVYYSERLSGYAVRYHRDVEHFMLLSDFMHSFVEVPKNIPVEPVQ